LDFSRPPVFRVGIFVPLFVQIFGTRRYLLAQLAKQGMYVHVMYLIFRSDILIGYRQA
jgi:hypothetical protein